MKEFDLEEITLAITQRYNWGSPSEWTNYHFKELSKAILEETGDRISEETLKRIFGKRKVDTENYQPQAYSKLALIKFTSTPKNRSLKKNLFRKKIQKRNKLNRFISVSFIIGIIILISFLNIPKHHSFSCKNAIDFYPYTATFHYDITDYKDSVFAIFENERETYLAPSRSMINFFYQKAGVYNVVLKTRSKVLDSLRITVNCRDWQAGFFPNDSPKEFQPFYDQQSFRQLDHFYATPELLKNEDIDLKQNYYTCYRYFSSFNKSLDKLILETRVQNNAMTGSFSCYDTGISLIGESGTIDFKFTQPKCSRYASLQISEKHFDGKYCDLSPLSVDMSDWLDIMMKTENGNFNLYLADDLVFSEEYKQSLGNLLGVIYYFYGTGKIDHLVLKDSENTQFYQTNFSRSKN